MSLMLGLRTTIIMKKIVLGPADKLPQQALALNNKPIDRVHSFKLLGVVINDSLT